MTIVACSLCPECGSVISRETDPPTLVELNEPLDSNDPVHLMCMICGFSREPVLWSLGNQFAGRPVIDEPVCSFESGDVLF